VEELDVNAEKSLHCQKEKKIAVKKKRGRCGDGEIRITVGFLSSLRKVQENKTKTSLMERGGGGFR
jgi:hypothetical protein